MSYSICRNQKAEDRWCFSAIVDELLNIVDEVPNSKNVEVWSCGLQQIQTTTVPQQVNQLLIHFSSIIDTALLVCVIHVHKWRHYAIVVLTILLNCTDEYLFLCIPYSISFQLFTLMVTIYTREQSKMR